MKVLVTGANGLLATNTIFRLLESGYSVRALVRDKNNFLLPPSDYLEVVEGDITISTSTENLAHGCDYIIHTAAESRQGLARYSDYSVINIEGTRNIFASAAKYNVRRVIYVSTSNVFGYGTILEPGTENSSIKKPFSDSRYVNSKLEAQKIALSFSDKMDVIIVNPAFIIGPYDQKPSSGRIILMVFNKRVILHPPGGKNFINASDAAEAIVNALKKGNNREFYLLANENLSYRQFFKKVSAYADVKPLMVKIPKFFFMLLGYIGNIITFFGINTDATLTNMRIISSNSFYSGKKSERDLQINYKPVEADLSKAIEWFKLQKRL